MSVIRPVCRLRKLDRTQLQQVNVSALPASSAAMARIAEFLLGRLREARHAPPPIAGKCAPMRVVPQHAAYRSDRSLFRSFGMPSRWRQTLLLPAVGCRLYRRVPGATIRLISGRNRVPIHCDPSSQCRRKF